MIVCLNEGKQLEKKQKGEPFNCAKLSSSQELTNNKKRTQSVFCHVMIKCSPRTSNFYERLIV